MSKTLFPTYEPTNETLYIRPSFSIDHEAYVKEMQQNYKIKQPPNQIIHTACLDGGASYDGRKSAVIHNTGIQSKIPIPINPNQNLYAFPTHSPQSVDNIWIFFHNVYIYKKHPTDSTQSIIQFVNRETLTVPISFATLERQMHRTAYCVFRFGDGNSSAHRENKSVN
ncbi:hypothetical protein AJ85_00275 [Alkalihalobacillus alcalophilus ATCC 27647 = CGMCC 1.3604]|uniref:Competence protein n=1 Tax=Alkalihalobacillus alcalophilus ATCC 27647 = CGMCC 1.3604 TaxID=1218173 RepID=A0A094WPC3_ALKAL|nr:competence protein ComK [Alkalihalobacillus alcalophilus]KGA98671.1 hypothetical protein BALCAV_0203390 [Alkalihalobacillus alcalophilus ATCC 27647 = CGMCC 1.3604]THG88733.1 hypothetical protein AJ85_00275 [Alkalihalobacillus alcalophilus ATCC 27647 = CGMCC 1.3604]